jgi:hypothetical protein
MLLYKDVYFISETNPKNDLAVINCQVYRTNLPVPPVAGVFSVFMLEANSADKSAPDGAGRNTCE